MHAQKLKVMQAKKIKVDLTYEIYPLFLYFFNLPSLHKEKRPTDTPAKKVFKDYF
jgi:hypothetical protein